MSEQLPDQRELLPASEEVLAELARVRSNFLNTFESKPPGLSTEIADNFFDSHGLQATPVVSVPHTQEGYETAKAIANDTIYPLPFLAQKFTPERAQLSPWSQGLGFFVSVYGLNFLSDSRSKYTSIIDEETAERQALSTYGHELAHSVFHTEPHVYTEQSDDGSVAKIYGYHPLSGLMYQYYDADAPDLLVGSPIWAEEAFACYVDGQISKVMSPEGDGHYVEFEGWGEGGVSIDEHYIVRSIANPGQGFILAGAIAGQTLEMIDGAPLPGTVERMMQIARGELSGDEFRNDLRQRIAPKLFELMFTQQPYTTWLSIFDRAYDINSYS